MMMRLNGWKLTSKTAEPRDELVPDRIVDPCLMLANFDFLKYLVSLSWQRAPESFLVRFCSLAYIHKINAWLAEKADSEINVKGKLLHCFDHVRRLALFVNNIYSICGDCICLLAPFPFISVLSSDDMAERWILNSSSESHNHVKLLDVSFYELNLNIIQEDLCSGVGNGFVKPGSTKKAHFDYWKKINWSNQHELQTTVINMSRFDRYWSLRC